jgi:hypothetical protein
LDAIAGRVLGRTAVDLFPGVVKVIALAQGCDYRQPAARVSFVKWFGSGCRRVNVGPGRLVRAVEDVVDLLFCGGLEVGFESPPAAVPFVV